MKHLRAFNESEKYLEIDVSILSDIYCDLADKYNIEIKYDNSINRIIIKKNEVMDFIDIKILRGDINEVIDRSIEYYYEETNKKIFAYILNYNYFNFYMDNAYLDNNNDQMIIKYEFYNAQNVSYVNSNYLSVLFLPKN